MSENFYDIFMRNLNSNGINFFKLSISKEINDFMDEHNIRYYEWSDAFCLKKFAPSICQKNRPFACIDVHSENFKESFDILKNDFRVLSVECLKYYISSNILCNCRSSTLWLPLYDCKICFDCPNLISSELARQIEFLGGTVYEKYEDGVEFAISTCIDYSENIERFVRCKGGRENVLTEKWIEECQRLKFKNISGRDICHKHRCPIFHHCLFLEPHFCDDIAGKIYINGGRFLKISDSKSINIVVLSDDDPNYFEKISASLPINVKVVKKEWVFKSLDNQFLAKYYSDILDDMKN